MQWVPPQFPLPWFFVFPSPPLHSLFAAVHYLVLSQRAAAKITFPGIWANTCCSHPLNIPSETIEENALGVKNAARRKLQQELGIDPEEVPLESFHYITRVHYSAESDEVWGEHEIDHVLVCLPPAGVKLNLNPNEVDTVEWVDEDGLEAWMKAKEEAGEVFSPWFRGIGERLLHSWWTAVKARDAAMLKALQDDTIHRLGHKK